MTYCHWHRQGLGRILRLNKVVGEPFKEKQTSITLGFCSHYVDSTTYHIVLCRLWRTTCVRPKPIPIQVWKALRSLTSNRPDPKRCPCRRISSKNSKRREHRSPMGRRMSRKMNLIGQ